MIDRSDPLYYATPILTICHSERSEESGPSI